MTSRVSSEFYSLFVKEIHNFAPSSCTIYLRARFLGFWMDLFCSKTVLCLEDVNKGSLRMLKPAQEDVNTALSFGILNISRPLCILEQNDLTPSLRY